MTVLVTGSSGHLGEALMRTLRASGCAAVGLDLIAGPFTDEVGSVSDLACVARCIDGADTVFHAATLHKPHVGTHSRAAFVETNVMGTLVLLEAAARARVRAFVMTSTTSAFGDALKPPPGAPAAWIDERVAPAPKNIYGVTKTAAEDLCQLFHRNERLATIVLRTSRFFPEEDDDPEACAGYADDNSKANEYLFRRVAIEDVVDAHLAAAERAPAIGFGKYVISATTPFLPEDCARLRADAPAVVSLRAPGWRRICAPRLGHVPEHRPRLRQCSCRTRSRLVAEWDFAAIVERRASPATSAAPSPGRLGRRSSRREVRGDAVSVAGRRV